MPDRTDTYNMNQTTVAISHEDIPGMSIDIARLITNFHATILATTIGKGQYNGKPEQTAITLALVPSEFIDALRAHLAVIAFSYRQDAIGFTAAPSDTTLVYAEQIKN